MRDSGCVEEERISRKLNFDFLMAWKLAFGSAFLVFAHVASESEDDFFFVLYSDESIHEI